jgi:phage shock protein PspC (stress-responsive transcriptional regulator)
LWGTGLAAYLIFWICMPAADEPQQASSN